MSSMARILRYDFSGNWYKGSTHLHSTASDGGMEFKAVAELYKSANYDFLFRTDHWVLSDVRKDKAAYPLLWIDGVELHGADHAGGFFHVLCLGRVEGVTMEGGLEAAMLAAKQQGALVFLAHPHWCGNTLEDALRWPFDGVEIYNHVCHWLNGKGHGLVHWDVMLKKNPASLGLAVDDAHLKPTHPGWNGGWIMVNAPECSEQAILKAIRAGNYYSSCGPEIHSVRYEGTTLTVKTSPVHFMRIVGPNDGGRRTGFFDGKLLTEATFEVPEKWGYVYLEVEDPQGRRAWTNHLFAG